MSDNLSDGVLRELEVFLPGAAFPASHPGLPWAYRLQSMGLVSAKPEQSVHGSAVMVRVVVTNAGYNALGRSPTRK